MKAENVTSLIDQNRTEEALSGQMEAEETMCILMLMKTSGKLESQVLKAKNSHVNQ